MAVIRETKITFFITFYKQLYCSFDNKFRYL